jgi:sugar/nucleoside kinase (ribokinase family)
MDFAMVDVTGIGLNAIDYLCVVPRFPGEGEKLRMSAFVRQGGGQVATALCALRRWGLSAVYCGNVGEDEHGRLSRSLLAAEGMDLSHVRTVPGAVSQFAVILVDGRSGERTILWMRPPELRILPEDLPYEAIRSSRAILLDGHDVDASVAAARAARAAAVPVVLDAEKVQEGTGALLRLVDHVVASSDFPERLLGAALPPEEAAREIFARCAPRSVVITLGERGAVGFDGRELFRSPAVSVPAVDTTGAGDIFHAGFLFALLAGDPLPRILAFANAAAGLSCRGLGGRGSIPSIDEIRSRQAD